MNKTARQAARDREPLDGADAQALEGALTLTERELAAAEERNRELTRERDALQCQLRRIALHARAIIDERHVEPIEDLGAAIARMMRSVAYEQARELAVRDGATREQAHAIAHEASLREWPR